MKRGRWTQGGLLAMAGAALGQEFDCEDPGGEPFRMVGSVAVVSICGPIAFRPSWFWTNYGEIKSRVRAALDSSATAVMLDIDSPGGDVASAFETARELRALAAQKAKPLVAFTESQCASAAYALACAAQVIYVTASAQIGSVGVINALADQTALDKAMGLRFEVIGSGARKTDANPHVGISDAAIAEMQSHVDQLADLFFAWVAEARGISIATIRGYEAAQFIGANAVAARLADLVVTREVAFALINARAALPPKQETPKKHESSERPSAKEENDMDPKEKKAMIALLKSLRDSVDDDKREEIDEALQALGEKSDDEEKPEKKDGDDEGAKGMSRADLARMDQQMGLAKDPNAGIKKTETSITLGNMTPSQARAHLAKLERDE